MLDAGHPAPPRAQSASTCFSREPFHGVRQLQVLEAAAFPRTDAQRTPTQNERTQHGGGGLASPRSAGRGELASTEHRKIPRSTTDQWRAAAAPRKTPPADAAATHHPRSVSKPQMEKASFQPQQPYGRRPHSTHGAPTVHMHAIPQCAAPPPPLPKAAEFSRSFAP